jgi:hypothetical protein
VDYLVGGSLPVSQAKVVLLHQVEMVTHSGEQLLAFGMFLKDREREGHIHNDRQTQRERSVSIQDQYICATPYIQNLTVTVKKVERNLRHRK